MILFVRFNATIVNATYSTDKTSLYSTDQIIRSLSLWTP